VDPDTGLIEFETLLKIYGCLQPQTIKRDLQTRRDLYKRNEWTAYDEHISAQVKAQAKVSASAFNALNDVTGLMHQDVDLSFFGYCGQKEYSD
jgi:hypothetical protein